MWECLRPAPPTPERVPDEERVVRRIKSLHGRGYSLRAIAARLEEDGVRTKTGGTRWHAKVIWDVLAQRRMA